MKTISSLIFAGLTCLSASFALAADPVKPLLTLTVKKHLLDSDHEKRGGPRSTQDRTITLRVDIVNAGKTAIDGAELSGQALVMRATDIKEKLVKEPLGPLKIPLMKPGERITLDLGKIELHEKEWRNRKFEETLDEWLVTGNQAGAEIGRAVSSPQYDSQEKAAFSPKGPGGKKKRAAQ